MARISYVEEKDHPELAADIAKIKGARGGLINIYKLLLHSPTVTMTWFEHIGAIRWKTKLTPRLREIAIVRVARRRKYAYALQRIGIFRRCAMRTMAISRSRGRAWSSSGSRRCARTNSCVRSASAEATCRC